MSQGERNIRPALKKFRETHPVNIPSFKIGNERSNYRLSINDQPDHLWIDIRNHYDPTVKENIGLPYISSFSIGLDLDQEGNVTGISQLEHEKQAGKLPQFAVNITLPSGSIVQMTYMERMNNPGQAVLMQISQNNTRLNGDEQRRMIEELEDQKLHLPEAIDAFATVMEILVEGEIPPRIMRKNPFIESKLIN